MGNTNGSTENGTIKLPRGHKPPPSNLVEEPHDDTEQSVRLKPEDYAPKVIAIDIEVEQITSLIINAFSAKSRQQMLDAQMQVAKTKREPKDPQKLFEGAKYKDAKGRDCIYIGSFRNAMIAAARNIDGITMAALKQAIFLEGPDGPSQTLLPITYDTCVMREDAVRNDSGTADIRFRPEYQGWSTKFRVHVLKNVVSVVQAYQLIELAGFSVGVGEWRPAGKNGMGGPFGRFKIKRNDP